MPERDQCGSSIRDAPAIDWRVGRLHGTTVKRLEQNQPKSFFPEGATGCWVLVFRTHMLAINEIGHAAGHVKLCTSRWVVSLCPSTTSQGPNETY